MYLFFIVTMKLPFFSTVCALRKNNSNSNNSNKQTNEQTNKNNNNNINNKKQQKTKQKQKTKNNIILEKLNHVGIHMVMRCHCLENVLSAHTLLPGLPRETGNEALP